MISRGLKKIVDTRIHLVLYFFDGHHPKDQDFHSVRVIQEYSNVIPILAKGDSFTLEELKHVKQKIVKRAKELKVEFFNIRSTLEDIEDTHKRDVIIKECLTEHFLSPCPPFSIINPSQIKLKENGEKLLGRNYGWGFADCFNPDNSDFNRLHKLILRYLRSELIWTLQQKYQNFEQKLKQTEENRAYRQNQ